MRKRKRFYGINSESFVSAADKAALLKLQQLPFLPNLIQKFHDQTWDRVNYIENASQSIRCGAKQFPSLHRSLREAVKILDAPEPELYIRSHPLPDAYSAGLSRPYIVLNSALVDQFEPDELLFVLGHELGHIKCGHLLYLMVGKMLIPLMEAIGQMTFGAGAWVGRGLIVGFYEWMRQSEFSCDRSGTLVCQDPQVAFSALMKLGCGSTRLNDEMSVDAFLDQARHFSDLKVEGVAKALTFLMHNWQESHPQVIHRAKDLEEWIKSGAYDAILSGDYLREPTLSDLRGS